MKNKSASKCINPTCDRGQSSRGLCRSCYNTAARLVREGKTTWAALEKAKRSLPPTNGAAAAAWLLKEQ